MKELDVATFLAVFQEMLGPLSWALIALAYRHGPLRPGCCCATAACGRAASWRSGGRRRSPAEEIAAVLFMLAVTQSQLADIGEPVDWVLVAVIFVAGGVGTVVAASASLGKLRRLAQPRRATGRLARAYNQVLQFAARAGRFAR